MSAVESGDHADRPAPDLSFLDRPAPRAPEIPNLQTHNGDKPDAGVRRAGDGKVLTIGAGINVNGEISDCDTLVVEGTVSATLSAGHKLDISHGGVFNGSAEVDSAIIAGHFEGDLTVRDRLQVAASGRVEGKVRYGKLEIEAGGEVNGDLSVSSAGS